MATPCSVVKKKKSHSTTVAEIPPPTTKNPRTHVTPRIGTRTSDACIRVLENAVHVNTNTLVSTLWITYRKRQASSSFLLVSLTMTLTTYTSTTRLIFDIHTDIQSFVHLSVTNSHTASTAMTGPWKAQLVPLSDIIQQLYRSTVQIASASVACVNWTH